MPTTSVLEIHQLLRPGTVCVGLPGETKEEVINNLVDLLEGHPAVRDLEAVRRAVFERENVMSTGVGKSLGLPHAKTPAVQENVAAFAITKHPVPFGAIDGKPVRLLFLLVGTETAKSQHIKILSRISRLMNRDTFRDRLLSARDAGQVLHAFEEGEAQLFEGQSKGSPPGRVSAERRCGGGACGTRTGTPGRSMFQNIKGTFDILPEASSADGTQVAGSAAWRNVEATIRDVMQRFNFEEIRTPIFEETELIARGIGAMTDIVTKEMFAFERGDTNYVLRPEVTAPVMRAYLQHHLDQRGGVQKLYYIGPCFRAEKPQKGRYRQFHQFGCEVIGSDDARADAEVVAVMMAIYRAFGITTYRLRLNTLGDAESRPRYREALRAYLAPYADQLSETSRKRLETNPLRILDTKEERERRLLEDAPVLLDFIDEASRAHYEEVKALLDDLGIRYEEDPYLVRGLDYYTRTAFELESPSLGAQSALAGGGRYDLLALELGAKQPVPAVGFAAGIERLFLALDARGATLPGTSAPDVFLVALGDEAARWTFAEAQRLREAGLHAALDLRGRSMKAQMREANRQNAPFTVIVGKDELQARQAQVKNMETGEQEAVAFDSLAGYLRRTH